MKPHEPKTLDVDVLASLDTAFNRLKGQGLFTPKLSTDQLVAVLNEKQLKVVRQIFILNPKDYGADTPYAGDLEPVPSDLIRVSDQKYTENGKQVTLEDRFVPKHIYQAFTRMNNAFRVEHPDRTLLVGSCYRSPAFQIAVFVYWLTKVYDGDVARTIRQVSPPTYSQHTIASKAAVDIKNIEGSPTDKHPENFKETAEYAWLCQHAAAFGFYESWKENNRFGMKAEPWHWQYLGEKLDGQ